MGVGFQVSALHRISYIETIEDAPATKPPPGWLAVMPNTRWDGRPTRYVSPAVADIVTWRARIAAKYHHQLGETLTWDEASEFVAGEEASTGWDFDLRYVAAVLNQQGTATAARLLRGQPEPNHSATAPIFDAVEKLGFTGLFPQLLLGVTFWLPFRRNMIIEEQNWRGTLVRFGSIVHLLREIAEIRRFIKLADATAPSASEDDETVLPGAWKAADIIHRYGKQAVAKHLPFWTTD